MRFLTNDTAKQLYHDLDLINLPIIDYHCHLSSREIYENAIFTDIGEIWLKCDHYKWRLMRAFGIDEVYITGNASWHDKFVQFAKCIGTAAGNPLYHWTVMELERYFNITKPLNEDTAEEIYLAANSYIRIHSLSPRKLIVQSNVEYIGTTDDPIDSLEYHEKLSDFPVVVSPTFRTDKLVNIKATGYAQYIDELSKLVGFSIYNLDSFEKAVLNRLDYFCSHGCKMSDIGIEAFPGNPLSRSDVESIFRQAIASAPVSYSDYQSFLFYAYLFLANAYNERNIAMQLHLAVKRNVNSKLFSAVGADIGGDCANDPIHLRQLATLLDAMNDNGLPQTIIYTLNSSMYDTLSTVALSFPNVRIGAAWWFQDHKSGIEKQLRLYAETSHIATFLGMLTDSRSFLSYARHDYFRRILCSIIGEWIENGELYDDANARKIIKRICLQNIKELVL